LGLEGNTTEDMKVEAFVSIIPTIHSSSFRGLNNIIKLHRSIMFIHIRKTVYRVISQQLQTKVQIMTSVLSHNQIIRNNGIHVYASVSVNKQLNQH
jgi:hypothetical protein